MPRSITIAQMVKKYFQKIPGHREEISFVEYGGNKELYIYLVSGLKVIYNYKEDELKGAEVDVNYMNEIRDRWPITNEKEYRAVFSYLLRGRMDALEIGVDELAERSHVSRSTIHRILDKRVTPSAFTVYTLEKNLQNSKNDIWRFI